MVDTNELARHLAAVQVRCSAAGSRHGSEQECAALLVEVVALAECINRARADLAALGADDVASRHMPDAADELDAIVAHTAAATSTILDVCEQLEQAAAGTACQPAVSAATARIYEACSFQDITGQRVAKIVQTLQVVETRVEGILCVFGRPKPGTTPPLRSSALLNGPQSAKDAMDQTAIDALLENLE